MVGKEELEEGKWWHVEHRLPPFFNLKHESQVLSESEVGMEVVLVQEEEKRCCEFLGGEGGTVLLFGQADGRAEIRGGICCGESQQAPTKMFNYVRAQVQIVYGMREVGQVIGGTDNPLEE